MYSILEAHNKFIPLHKQVEVIGSCGKHGVVDKLKVVHTESHWKALKVLSLPYLIGMLEFVCCKYVILLLIIIVMCISIRR